MKHRYFYVIISINYKLKYETVVDVQTNEMIAKACKRFHEKHFKENHYSIIKIARDDQKTLEWLYSDELKELKEGK